MSHTFAGSRVSPRGREVFGEGALLTQDSHVKEEYLSRMGVAKPSSGLSVNVDSVCSTIHSDFPFPDI